MQKWSLTISPRGCRFVLLGVALGLCFSVFMAKHIKHCTNTREQNYVYRVHSSLKPKGSSTAAPDTSVLENSILTSATDKPNVADDKRLVLIGVMTAKKYLTTRVVAVYNTWANSFAGKVIFFTGGNVSEVNSVELPSEIPIVALPGVDDTYPPQKKSFMMLKYMFENYGNEYEWFMRADDDAYVRTDKLEDFLRSLNSNHLYFIGQPGRGNQAEFGRLRLAYNENFCMGGPGILFSRATLHVVAPHLEQCLGQMYTTHEDVEVGRCIRKFAGIPCTWAYEMQSIFYHNASGDQAFTGSLKHREVHRAITLHPIKDHSHFYRLHSYFQAREIAKKLYEAVQLQRDLQFIETELEVEGVTKSVERNGDYVTAFDAYNITGLPISLQKFSPSQTSDLLEWSFIGKNGHSIPNALNPRQKMSAASKEGLQDVIRELMEIINSMSKVRGRVIEFKELLYGYHRVDPLHGEDFVLDLLMTYKKYRGKKMTTPVRRHAYIQRPFAPLQLHIISESTKSSTQNFVSKPTNLVFIVPLSGRMETFERLLENYLFNCIASQIFSSESQPTLNLRLVIAYFGKETAEFQKLIDSFQLRIRKMKAPSDYCQIKVVKTVGNFSRGAGLQTGINSCQDDDLLFLLDVDIVVSPEAIGRTIRNTIQGSQVYFPIVFSEYSNKFLQEELKNSTNFQISEDTGYWREFGFGIAAFYKSDFQTVGGFDLSIKGWGKEDVTLYDKFIQTNLTIFRAADPELLHIYHPAECDSNLPKAQMDMCIGSQATTLGSWKNLLKFILRGRHRSKYFQHAADLLFGGS